MRARSAALLVLMLGAGPVAALGGQPSLATTCRPDILTFNWNDGTTQGWTASASTANEGNRLRFTNNGSGSMQIFGPIDGTDLTGLDVVTFDLVFSSYAELDSLSGLEIADFRIRRSNFSLISPRLSELVYALDLTGWELNEKRSFTLPVESGTFIDGGYTLEELLQDAFVDFFFQRADNEPQNASGLLDNLRLLAAVCDCAAAGAVLGGAGDDVLVGTPGPDTLCGLGGDDVLDGRGGRDCLLGGVGDDVVLGRGGDDCLIGEQGLDVLLGGGGNDRLDGGPGADLANGGAGSDEILGGKDRDLLLGRRGSDTLDGGRGADTLRGHGDNDELSGGGGNDKLLGGSGDDRLIGGRGADDLRGGDGTDECLGGPGADTLTSCEG